MRKILFTFILTTFIYSIQAQSNYCGTVLSDEQLSWLRNHQNTYVHDENRGGSTYYIPMKVHIVGTDDGTGYYNLTYLFTAICELNEHYTPTGFVFYIYGDINYIDESDFYEHGWDDGSDMMDENNVNDLLNVYFVSDPAGNCGYFSGYDDGVAVAKSCAMPGGTTIAHEFGHYFSLPHTFYGWEGDPPDESDQEWVNGDNCDDAADGFCDTPPDYLNYRWNCPGPLQTDPWGETFLSDGTLYMSYSNDGCTNRFSEEQMDAMRENLLGPRNDLLDYPTPVYVDLTGVPELVTPEDLAIGLYPNYTYLEWTPIEGATEYHIQISYSSGFTAIAHEDITPNNFYEETTLDPDKKYYWRVKPLAPLNTCEGVSLARSFNTGSEMSAIEESNLFDHFAINPNPVISGTEINIDYNSNNSSSGSVIVYNIAGEMISAENISVFEGAGKISLKIPEVSEGIYVLEINNGIDSEMQKIMITK
ncbi:MAG: T9SS type A sorting domain-containing protein [Chitinophagales bacterium]